MIPETLTIQETMAALHGSRAFVYKLIGDGTLKSYRIRGKRLVNRDSLAKLFR